MEKIVLIGERIAHSLSPRLHNHLFARYDLPYRYELMALEADQLLGTIESMKRGGYRGANVTSPYKQAVIEGLDTLSEEAVGTGAVNTILFTDGEAYGHNTDVHGFERSLIRHPLLHSRFTTNMLGTGGAARAAAYVILRHPKLERLQIYSRDVARAVAAAAQWNDPRVTGLSLSEYLPADLVVHATPVGLAGDSGSILTEHQLMGTRLLYEMIYFPDETPLMRAAKHAGCETIGGMRMFIAQALRSFEIWTGLRPEPTDLSEEFLSTGIT